MTSETNTNLNAGARVYLEQSNDGVAGWAPVTDVDWDQVIQWGTYSTLPRHYLRASQSGNAVTYYGLSPYSDVYNNT
jgi:hypothetical protein